MKVYVEKKDIGRKITTYHDGLGTKQGLYVYGKDKIEVLSLADYTNQVRKEVCEEIRNRIENYSDCVLEDYENPEDTAIYGVFKNILEDVEEVKDQIQSKDSSEKRNER